MIQLRKLTKPLSILGGLIILSVIVILYLYSKFNIIQVYYSPTKKYKIERGFRFSSEGDRMDNLYRLINTENSEVIWEWNWQGNNLEYIKWKDEGLYLFFLSTESISKLKFNIETGKVQYLDSAEWEQAIGEW